ncbi:MAG: YfjI family protein [Candidatus Bathyarchaeota archaeon]|nr:YfjI family protein [Candidatus Bathyarchaeota archaeon]
MGWIQNYLTYTADQESPTTFHRWCAVAIIAGATGRKVWLNRRSAGVTRYRVFPGQIIVCLVSGSGARKTAAVHLPRELLTHVKAHIIAGKASPEAFLDQFNKDKGGNPQSVLLEDELSVLISKATYAEPIIDVLCKLADAPIDFPFRTRSGGDIIIKQPCLTGLLGTTPDSLGKRMPEGAIGAGFTARVAFVFDDSTERVEPLSDVLDWDVNEEKVDEMTRLRKILEDRILEISQQAGMFVFSPGGKTWFDEWYKAWRTSPEGRAHGWPSKRHDHLLRVAMCLALSRSNELVLTEGVLKGADKMLSAIEMRFDSVFSHVGEHGIEKNRIIDALTINGGQMEAGELFFKLKNHYPNLDVLRANLTYLQESRQIKCTLDATKANPTYTWELVDKPDWLLNRLSKAAASSEEQE